MSYFKRMLQDAIVSPANSSVANLAASGVFLGTLVDTLGVNSIQVSLATNQNCHVDIEQSPDGTNWDISDQYDFNKLLGNFGVTVTAVSSWVRVRVTNLSSTTATTYFRLQTVLCPFTSALPRSLDDQGHLKIAVMGLRDGFGFEGEFTPMRDLKIAEPVRLVGTVFGASIDTIFWTASNTGAGSAAGVATSIATLTSGTANSGYGQIQSTRAARFVFAHPMMWRGLVRINELVKANNTARFGPFLVTATVPQNGAYFAVDGAGALSLNYVNNGSVTTIANGSFNQLQSEYTLDANVHAYEIVYFTASINFYVDNILLHKVTPTTSILYRTITVPITIQTVNSASGTTSRTIECWNSSILRLGKNETQAVHYFQTATTAGVVLKTGAGILRTVVLSAIGNNSAITLYDNTAASGTVLWASGAMPNNAVPISLDFGGVSFDIGLTLVVATIASNVMVIYE